MANFKCASSSLYNFVHFYSFYLPLLLMKPVVRSSAWTSNKKRCSYHCTWSANILFSLILYFDTILNTQLIQTELDKTLYLTKFSIQIFNTNTLFKNLNNVSNKTLIFPFSYQRIYATHDLSNLILPVSISIELNFYSSSHLFNFEFEL